MSTGARLLHVAAALDRFLVFGIFTNLAIIKDDIIKMFSLLRVIWTIWEVSQLIQHVLTSRKKLLDRSWKRLFVTRQFPTAAKTCLLPVKKLLFKKTDTFFYLSTLYLLDALVSLISLRFKFYFSFFLDMKIWTSCAGIWNSLYRVCEF